MSGIKKDLLMDNGKLQRDLKKRRPFEMPEQEVVVSIRRTNELFQHRFAKLFREYGLTQPQYNILRILRGEGDKLPSLEIANRMITVVPAITSLIDKLEKRELVKRERCGKDRRIWYVGITQNGEQLLKEMDKPNRAMHKKLVGSLSKKECKELLILLEKAREAIIR